MKYPILTILLLILFSCSSSSETENNPPETVVSLPTTTTAAAMEITEVSALLGGTVSDDGGANITERGIVWDVATGPTTGDNKVSIGSGSGNFSSTIQNLEPSTSYFVRSYAINSKGTAYGNEITFTTLDQEPQAKVYEGNINLYNQSLVDSFGAENYTEVTGEVRIYGTVTDLMPLSKLEIIGQDLLISNADNLVSMDGLENVVEVGESVQFVNNDALTDITALEDLNAPYAVIFIGNDALKSISGFSQTTHVSGLIMLTGNLNLEVISGFQNLESTGYNLQIEDNPSLVDISGLSKLKSVGNELWLNNNDMLVDITPLNTIETINNIVINGNASLTEISTFNNISSCTIEISGNSSLASIQGFESLTDVGALRINNNLSLTTVTAFGTVTSLDSFIEIQYNQLFDDFCAFSGLITNDFTGGFSTWANAYNPTIQDMIDGNCKP